MKKAPLVLPGSGLPGSARRGFRAEPLSRFGKLCPPLVTAVTCALLLMHLSTGFVLAHDTVVNPERTEWQLGINEQKWLEAHPRIRLGDDFAWPPFVFTDDKGIFNGISAGYVAAITKLLGIQIEPVYGLSWTQVMEKIKRGEIDMLPAVVRSKEREAFLNFTKPFIVFPVVIATHTEGAFIANLEMLAKRKVGVVRGYITHERLSKEFPQIDLVLFDTLAAGLVALESRQIEAMVDNLGSITYEIRHLRLANVKITAPTPYQFELAMAVRKDWPELVKMLDQSL
ncbi:MAG: transporter substrate-binding domain-containing protein, partial [Magnetococcales bacterium]|nr:transporter substrate-binding domain-containing protein [Magnetococcales bacterium]